MYKSKEYGFVYASVPKVASTSIKNLIFHLENNEVFKGYDDGGGWAHIHREFPRATKFKGFSQEDLENFPFRFCIVRDPVQRLMSCYNDKLGMFAKNALEDDGIYFAGQDDHFSYFVENLEKISQSNNEIKHHCSSLVHFLGDDPSVFTNIYNISQIGELERDLSQHVNRPLKSYHKNKSKGAGQLTHIPHATIAKIEDIYEEDYRTFGSFF